MDRFLKVMGAKHVIYHDVVGAPFKIGDNVKFVYSADETAYARFLNRDGWAKRLLVCNPQLGVMLVKSDERQDGGFGSHRVDCGAPGR